MRADSGVGASHGPWMSPQEFRPERKWPPAAVVAVAANYVYFLLFAQFGFLKILQAATGGAAGVVKPVMAAMGLAGIGASVLAARIFSPERSRRVLATGFTLNALAAGLALLGGPLAVYYLVALLVGLGIGLTSVTLAGILWPAVGELRGWARGRARHRRGVWLLQSAGGFRRQCHRADRSRPAGDGSAWPGRCVAAWNCAPRSLCRGAAITRGPGRPGGCWFFSHWSGSIPRPSTSSSTIRR